MASHADQEPGRPLVAVQLEVPRPRVQLAVSTCNSLYHSTRLVADTDPVHSSSRILATSRLRYQEPVLFNQLVQPYLETTHPAPASQPPSHPGSQPASQPAGRVACWQRWVRRQLVSAGSVIPRAYSVATGKFLAARDNRSCVMPVLKIVVKNQGEIE